jgi:hypothetical protein
MKMANILVNLEHGIEVGAADVLKFLTSTDAVVSKAAPGVVAALGVVLGATETALQSLSQSSANPLNIVLDVATLKDIEAVWPSIVSFATSIGIKL